MEGTYIWVAYKNVFGHISTNSWPFFMIQRPTIREKCAWVRSNTWWDERPVFFGFSIFQQTSQLATEKFQNLCNCNWWSGLLQLGSVRFRSFFQSSKLDLWTLTKGHLAKWGQASSEKLKVRFYTNNLPCTVISMMLCTLNFSKTYLVVLGSMLFTMLPKMYLTLAHGHTLVWVLLLYSFYSGHLWLCCNWGFKVVNITNIEAMRATRCSHKEVHSCSDANSPAQELWATGLGCFWASQSW